MTTTNEINIAVALEYDGNSAPKVTAKGDAELAEKIIAIAKHHGVPLQENPELVQMLSHLEIGEEIPEVLYIAVAEIIAFAYIMKGKIPANYK